MAFHRFLFLFSCASVSTWIIARADAPSIHLVRQSATQQINPIGEQLRRGVKWSHGGYFLRDEIGGKPPTFYSLDRDGVWTGTAQFRNSEPVGVYSFGYDRETNGTIVFSGQTETAPRVVAPFLAWTSADGQNQRMVRTGNYFPYQVAVAPDDTVWTLGYEMVNLDDKDPAVNQNAHVLRHFDTAGHLIGSAFPQSQFDRHQRFRLGDSLLVATRDRLGWYGPRAGDATYTEISLAGMTMKNYAGASHSSPKSAFALELAITNRGATSVSVQDHSKGLRTNYVLDRDSAIWVPVHVPAMGGFLFTPNLIGSDGDSLVFKYGNEAGFFSVSN